MTNRIKRGNLNVAETLVNFIENEALPGTNISADRFWDKLEKILNKFVPENKRLLEVRAKMKSQIDDFYKSNSGRDVPHDEYINFLISSFRSEERAEHLKNTSRSKTIRSIA